MTSLINSRKFNKDKRKVLKQGWASEESKVVVAEDIEVKEKPRKKRVYKKKKAE